MKPIEAFKILSDLCKKPIWEARYDGKERPICEWVDLETAISCIDAPTMTSGGVSHPYVSVVSMIKGREEIIEALDEFCLGYRRVDYVASEARSYGHVSREYDESESIPHGNGEASGASRRSGLKGRAAFGA